jgi:hypothetical protein
MTSQFIPGITAPNSSQDNAFWLAFAGADLLVYENGTTPIIPTASELSTLPKET